jgi:hypothetical protein
MNWITRLPRPPRSSLSLAVVVAEVAIMCAALWFIPERYFYWVMAVLLVLAVGFIGWQSVMLDLSYRRYRTAQVRRLEALARFDFDRPDRGDSDQD